MGALESFTYKECSVEMAERLAIESIRGEFNLYASCEHIFIPAPGLLSFEATRLKGQFFCFQVACIFGSPCYSTSGIERDYKWCAMIGSGKLV